MKNNIHANNVGIAVVNRRCIAAHGIHALLLSKTKK